MTGSGASTIIVAGGRGENEVSKVEEEEIVRGWPPW